MADNEDKNKEEAIKKMQEQFAEMRRQQNQRELAAYAEANRRKLDARNLDELREAAFCSTDPKTGKKVSYWDDALGKAEGAINSEQNAYNDWRSAMMSLLTMFSQATSAMFNSRAQFLAEEVSPLTYIPFREGVLVPMKDYVLSKCSRHDKLAALPDFVQDIKIENGRVEFPKLHFSDDIKNNPKFNEASKMLFDLWLLSKGYKFDENAWKKLDKEGNIQPNQALTQTDLEELNKDGSFKKFLEEAGMKFEQSAKDLEEEEGLIPQDPPPYPY